MLTASKPSNTHELKMLLYIEKHQPVSDEEILKAFRADKKCKLRIDSLLDKRLIEREKWVQVDSGFYGKMYDNVGRLILREESLNLLEPYKEKRKEKIQSNIKFAVAAVMIPIATALLTHVLNRCF